MPRPAPVTTATLPVKSYAHAALSAGRGAAAGDDPLGGRAQVRGQGPAHVVGEVDHDLAHLVLVELAVVERALELDVEQIGLPERGEHPDGDQPALAHREPGRHHTSPKRWSTV